MACVSPLDAASQPKAADLSPEIDGAIGRAAAALAGHRRPDGHWAFELESDATVPAEFVLLQHHLDEIDDPLQRRIGTYLRETQGDDGGWPLFHGGALDLSASVKAYFALKAVGDPADAPHMARARQAILAHGGAACSNVFTRTLLALFGEVPWRAVPVMPVEIMNLPRWFPFHVAKIAYWSRTVLVPLLVIAAHRPRARNPRGIGIQELFVEPPEQVRDWYPTAPRTALGRFFRNVDRLLRAVEPLFPARSRRLAIERAVAFVTERLNGENGHGAIYPAMANVVIMFDCLGYAPSHPAVRVAKAAIVGLVADDGERAYVHPCLSPVWDTAFACHALAEAGGPAAELAHDGAQWLIRRQVLDVVGDWAARRPDVRPGGWAFQYANPHYPDLDDTAVVVMLLDRLDRARHRTSIERGAEWVLGLQSRNGGWGAFDADNTQLYLNSIPFADHGALLDPPSADVTGRCLGMLGQLGYEREHPAVTAAVDFLGREQEADGSWYGRWGINYVYGTWSALAGLNAIGMDPREPMMRRAIDWLVSRQRPDGGWGEDGASYWPGQPHGQAAESTPSHTSWALLGLMAGGAVDHPAVARGVAHLMATLGADGQWSERGHNAVGFARVFYLRYHGYSRFFPLFSLARYRALKAGNTRTVLHGL